MTDLILGVDIGGVLIGGKGPEDTSFFTRNYLSTPAVPGGFEALQALTGLFGERIYLVSKCGPRVQGKSIHWLASRRFFEATGIPESRYRFCLKRDGKAPICAELGITHFVDDRLEILGSLPETVTHRYLFAPQEAEVQAHRAHLDRVKRVESWAEVLADLGISSSS